MQIPAPSKDWARPMLTVKFDAMVEAVQAGVPAARAGTVNAIW